MYYSDHNACNCHGTRNCKFDYWCYLVCFDTLLSSVLLLDHLILGIKFFLFSSGCLWRGGRKGGLQRSAVLPVAANAVWSRRTRIYSIILRTYECYCYHDQMLMNLLVPSISSFCLSRELIAKRVSPVAHNDRRRNGFLV